MAEAITETNQAKVNRVIGNFAKRTRPADFVNVLTTFLTAAFTGDRKVEAWVIDAASNPGATTLEDWLKWCRQAITDWDLGNLLLKGGLEMAVRVRNPVALAAIKMWAMDISWTNGPSPKTEDVRAGAEEVYDGFKTNPDIAYGLYTNRDKRTSKLSRAETSVLWFRQNKMDTKADAIVNAVKKIDKEFVFQAPQNATMQGMANKNHIWAFHQLAVIVEFYRQKSFGRGELLRDMAVIASSSNLGKTKTLAKHFRLFETIKMLQTDNPNKYDPPFCLTYKRVVNLCGMVCATYGMGDSVARALLAVPDDLAWDGLVRAWEDLANTRLTEGELIYAKNEIIHIMNYWCIGKRGFNFVNDLTGNFFRIEFKAQNL